MQSILLFPWRFFSTEFHLNPIISFSVLVLADSFSLTSYSHQHNAKRLLSFMLWHRIIWNVCVPYCMVSILSKSSHRTQNHVSHSTHHVRADDVSNKVADIREARNVDHATGGHCTSLSSVISILRPCKFFKWKWHLKGKVHPITCH